MTFKSYPKVYGYGRREIFLYIHSIHKGEKEEALKSKLVTSLGKMNLSHFNIWLKKKKKSHILKNKWQFYLQFPRSKLIQAYRFLRATGSPPQAPPSIPLTKASSGFLITVLLVLQRGSALKNCVYSQNWNHSFWYISRSQKQQRKKFNRSVVIIFKKQVNITK